jgi:hypothetical protein
LAHDRSRGFIFTDYLFVIFGIAALIFCISSNLGQNQNNKVLLGLRQPFKQKAVLKIEKQFLGNKNKTKRLNKKSPDFSNLGFFVPENVVPKARVELTQGHPYRFSSALLRLA